jgi:hypothetical protein
LNKNYKFEIHGVARNDQTWITNGTIYCDLNDSFDMAMRASFMQLTEGRAIYGKPGVGCQGPYNVLSVKIEQVKQ